MTSISEGFADLLGDGWATERARLGAIARRFVIDGDDADAVVEHAIDRLDPTRFVDDAEGARKAVDALELSVRRTAVDAIDAGAAPTVPTDLDEESFAAFALPSSDGFVASPLHEALGALPSAQRDLLLARIGSDMPPAKAAAAVGIDERAAAGAIRSARRALRAEVRAVVCEREGGDHARHARSSGQAAKAHLAGCQFCRDMRHPVGPPPRTARRPIALAATAGAPIALAAGAAAATAAAAPATPGEPQELDPATTPMSAALVASAAPSEPAPTTGGAERAHVPSVRRRRRRRGAIVLAAAAVAAATTVAVALATQDVQQGSVDDRADGLPADVSAAPVEPDDEESTGGVETPTPSTDATAPDVSEAPDAAEHDDAAAADADDTWSGPASDEATTPGWSAPPTWSAPQPTTAPAPAPTTGPAPAPAPTTPTQPPAPAPTPTQPPAPPAPPAPQPPPEDADPPLLPGLPPLLPELPPILPGLPPLLELIVP